MTWQPIETAPRDGTRVLVWREGQAYVAKWMDNPWQTWGVNVERVPGDWQPFSDIGPIGMGGYLDAHGPTHWMPVPDAPEAV